MVRLTDRRDMTIAVDWDVTHQTKPKTNETGRMPRWIGILAGCTCHFMVLSCCSSCVNESPWEETFPMIDQWFEV